MADDKTIFAWRLVGGLCLWWSRRVTMGAFPNLAQLEVREGRREVDFTVFRDMLLSDTGATLELLKGGNLQSLCATLKVSGSLRSLR